MAGDDMPTSVDSCRDKVPTSPCGSLLSDGPPSHIA